MSGAPRSSGAALRRPGRCSAAVLAAAPLCLVLWLPAAALAEEEPAVMDTSFLSGPVLPAWGLFSLGAPERTPPERPLRMNWDLSFGAYFPFDDDEDHDIGGTADTKFQAEVLRIPLATPLQYIFQIIVFGGLHRPREVDLVPGVEFAYAAHGTGNGEAFAEGRLDRLYFLVPIEFDFPILPGDSLLPLGAPPVENPFSIRLGVAPGLVYVNPELDEDLKNRLRAAGLSVEEDDILEFNLRFRAGFRMPLSSRFGFLFETAFDWADGKSKITVRDTLGGSISDRSHVNLSGLSVMVGFQLVF